MPAHELTTVRIMSTDANHAAVLALIDELLAIGPREPTPTLGDRPREELAVGVAGE